MKTSFVLPTDIEPLVRDPKATAPGECIELHHSMCYGCGDEAPVGLRIKVFAGEGLTVTATMPVVDWMQGGPGVIHGGVLSGAFDEVMGTSPLLLRKPVVTGHLAIDYARPIPLGSTLHFTGEILGGKGRKIYTRCYAHLGDPEQPVAGAHALFIAIDLEKHFADYLDKAVHSGDASS
ncbi:PaaI family thioesterase [Gordonia sp. (in: high G+C Gram-positive bacteria)]|uniref:PaaI family thioesterase n=1 Tax=Gordonia sp. (in: high G+C Gram-positive bacteria) TaxID=84139 RepID=UPI0016BD5C73|nr:PaaI family thioesterase [Gordonia sp. (in: high G+C Gram-positive bacteria)]NLG48175.1 PaaI family thioesterase [Gordonia sp. (in: high G+C Gram-positive bacteria)]